MEGCRRRGGFITILQHIKCLFFCYKICKSNMVPALFFTTPSAIAATPPQEWNFYSSYRTSTELIQSLPPSLCTEIKLPQSRHTRHFLSPIHQFFKVLPMTNSHFSNFFFCSSIFPRPCHFKLFRFFKLFELFFR